MPKAWWVTGLAVVAVACGSSSNRGDEGSHAAGGAGAGSSSTSGASGLSGSGGATDPALGDAGDGGSAGSGVDAGASSGGAADGTAGAAPIGGGGSSNTGGATGVAGNNSAGTSAAGVGGSSVIGEAGGTTGAGAGGIVGSGGVSGGSGGASSGGISGSGGALGGFGGLAGAGGAGGGNGCAEGSTGPNCSVCVVYVNKSGGNDANDGRTWASAKANVQNGIDAAYASNSPCNVWVAQGTYLPTYMADPFASAKTATLLMRPGVAIYGGFVGTEHWLEARNIAAYVTTLSGAITVAGKPDFLNHVVTSADGATLDGFTVSGGASSAVQCDSGSLTLANDTFTGNAGAEGGALNMGTCSAMISACIFNNNVARPYTGSDIAFGGAIYNNSGTLTIRNSAFTNNGTSAKNAGAGAIISHGPIDVRDSTFENNSAPNGGALYASSTSVLVQGCTFKGNHAFTASAIYAPQSLTLRSSTISDNTATVTADSVSVTGAVYGRDVVVENTTFSGNTAIATNGATSALGGGLYAYGVVKIKNSAFRGGLVSAGNGSSGAGFYCANNCSAQLVSVVFEGNVAKGLSASSTYGTGGALYFRGTTISLDDCLFVSNQAKVNGGAIYSQGTPAAFAVRSSTFYGNAAATGGAVYLSNGPATFLNSVFWGNTATAQGSQVFNAGLTATTVRSCDVQGSGFTGTNGNIDQDPLFMNTNATSLDLRLQSGSPCINSGSNADLALDLLDLDGDSNLSEPLPFDLENKARVQNTTLDMGAYESSY